MTFFGVLPMPAPGRTLGGELRVEANSSVTPLTSSSNITTGSSVPLQVAWGNVKTATTLAVLDCADDSTCSQQRVAEAYQAGYAQNSTLRMASACYAAAMWPVNATVPVTVEVRAADGARVATNEGAVSVTHAAMAGCGTGGTLRASAGTMTTQRLVDGRATFWLSLSSPCSNCRLRFTLVPTPSSTTFANMSRNTASFVAASQRFSVGFPRSIDSEVVVVRSRLPPQVVSPTTDISLQLAVERQWSSLLLGQTASNFSARVYNTLRPLPGMHVVGNGGNLRPAAGGPTGRFVLVRGTGAAATSFRFSRHCAECVVRVSWSVGASSGWFDVRNAVGTSFIVASPSSGFAITGVTPPRVKVHEPIHVAVRGAAGDFGFASSNATPGAATWHVAMTHNGDGGVVAVRSFAWGNGRAFSYLVSASAPCARCTITVARASVTTAVTAIATHLRVNYMGPSLTTVNDGFAVRLAAADDSGFTDVTAGGPSDCTLHYEFKCEYAAAPVEMVLSADGETAGGLAPVTELLTVGSADRQVRVVLSNDTLRDGIAAVHARISTPIRRLVPIFTSSVLSIASTNASRTRPVVDVIDPAASSALVLRMDLRRYSHHTLSPLVAYVGIGSLFGTLLRAYAAAGLNATVGLSYSAACGAGHPSSVFLDRGLGTLQLSFSASTPADVPCVVTARVIAGVACPSCSAVAEIVVADPPATSYIWLTPSALDNGGDPAGPYHAVAGRQQVLVLQGVAVVDGTTLPARCRSCTAQVTARCGNSPAIRRAYDALSVNGTIAFQVDWPAATTNYACELQVSVARGGSLIAGPASRYAVSVCVPRTIRVDNFSSTGVIRSGVVYPWSVFTTDASGSTCRGDSATTLRLSTATSSTAATQPYAFTVATGQLSPTSSMSSTSATRGGRGAFGVVVTAASQSPVRLRVEAQSVVPVLDVVRYSQAFIVVVEASRLRLRPDASLPVFIVGGRATADLVVQAVDAVPDSWVQVAPNAPNVDAAWSGYVEWTVDPIVHPFPMQFLRGGRLMPLAAGEGTASWNFTGPDGRYCISLRDPAKGLSGSAPRCVQAQRPTGLNFESSGSTCASPCAIAGYNRTGATAGALVVPRDTTITLVVRVVDATGATVLGDYQSRVGLRLRRATSQSTVQMADSANPSSSVAVVVSRCSAGRATFQVRFSGSTQLPSGAHERVQLEGFCPRVRGSSNPCLAENLAAALSIDVQVVNSITASQIAAELAQFRPTLSVPVARSSLADFDSAAFMSGVITALREFPAVWPRAANASALRHVTCEVDRSQFIVGSTNNVCDSTGVCRAAFHATCPAGVRVCQCAAAARSSSRRQSGSAIEVDVALTVFVSASDAARFASVPTMYEGIVALLVSVLRRPSFMAMGVAADRIAIVSRQQPTAVAPPSTTPALPSGTTTPADGTNSRVASSARGFSLYAVVCAAMAMLSMAW